MAADEPAYFLDHDGRLYLVQEQGRLRLPTRSEVPFAFAEKHRATLRGRVVVFGSPLDKRQRDDWTWKDELTFREDVDELARVAANLTLPRVVTKGAFLRGRDALLIKDKVGFYKGRWSLPGGYLDYGESPREGCAREAEEELGVKAEILRLIRVDSQVVPSGFHFITFHYEGRLADEPLRLKPDEVEHAEWMPLERAAREVASPHSRSALQDLLKEERRS